LVSSIFVGDMWRLHCAEVFARRADVVIMETRVLCGSTPDVAESAAAIANAGAWRAEELELLVDSKNGGRNFWAAVRVGRLERTFPSNQPYSHEYIDDVFLDDSHITLGWFEWSPRAPRCIAEARSRLAYRVSLRRTSLCLTEPTAVGDPVCFNLRLDSAITGMIGVANLVTELQSLLAGRCGLAGTDRYGMLNDLSASRAFHLSVYSGFTCQRRVFRV